MVHKAAKEAHPSAIDHERLASLINSMADGVLAIDEDLKIVLYNGAALNILDVNGSIAHKNIGRVLQLINRHGDQVELSKLIRKSTTPTSTRDYFIEYDDKSRVALYISIAPVHLSYGKGGLRGYVILLRDITHEKSLEDERNEFISVISHELRTPITIAEGNISNAIWMAQNSQKPEDVRSALEAAHDQVLFLANLINDLSMLSRAEGNKLKLDVDAINVHSMLEELALGYSDEALAKHLKINLELDPKLEVLYSSRLYVEEILQNLITNAIKYTDKGSVTIAAKPTDKGVSVSVEDTGIGISKADQEKIFQKFFRSEDYRTREHSGSGLGLYVTQKLIHILHAEITAESKLNKGSKFTIHFPNLQ